MTEKEANQAAADSVDNVTLKWLSAGAGGRTQSYLWALARVAEKEVRQLFLEVDVYGD